MKSWMIPAGSTNGPDALCLVELPTPEPGHGQVRVAMQAWSIKRFAFADAVQAWRSMPSGSHFGKIVITAASITEAG